MAINEIVNPYAYFNDPTKGRPVFNGKIYIGVADLDPTVPANQLQVTAKQENGDLVDIPQPILTNAGGNPTYNGSPVTLIINGDYSIAVHNKNDAQVSYQASALTGFTGYNTTVFPRQYGDGVTTVFPTPVSGQPNISADNFTVHLSGVYQLPGVDFIINQSNGSMQFIQSGLPDAPALNTNIDMSFSQILNFKIENPNDDTLITATGTITPRSLGDRFADTVTLNDFGAIGDGVTDDTAAIQAAFNSGNQDIEITGNYLCTQLTLPANTTITIKANSSIRYTGTGGTFLTTDVSRCTGKLNLICEGGTINIGSADIGINLTSCQSCEFDLYMDGTSPTAIAVDMNGNATSNTGAPYGTTRHFANNIMKRIYHIGICGTLAKCSGVNGAEGGVFTLNKFGLMRARDAKVIGMDISGWADTNDVQGPVNIHITNQDSIGIKFSNDATVYQWRFGLVSFGAYGTATGRTGVHLGNNTRQIEFEKVFVDGENLDNNGLGMIYEPPFIISYSVHGLEYAGAVGTTITQRSKNVFAVAAAFNSVNKSMVLQDNEATSVNLRNSYGIISVGSSDANASCIVSVRVTNDALEFCKGLGVNNPTFTKFLTGSLTGTTGQDGTFSVSAGTDGKVYFENRLGYGVRFVISVIGATSTDR